MKISSIPSEHYVTHTQIIEVVENINKTIIVLAKFINTQMQELMEYPSELVYTSPERIARTNPFIHCTNVFPINALNSTVYRRGSKRLNRQR